MVTREKKPKVAEPKKSARGGSKAGGRGKPHPVKTAPLSLRAPEQLLAWLDETAAPGVSRGSRALELLLEAAKAQGYTGPSSSLG